jgi:hypothetical protein
MRCITLGSRLASFGVVAIGATHCRHAVGAGKFVYLPADPFPVDAGPESDYQP